MKNKIFECPYKRYKTKLTNYHYAYIYNFLKLTHSELPGSPNKYKDET